MFVTVSISTNQAYELINIELTFYCSMSSMLHCWLLGVLFLTGVIDLKQIAGIRTLRRQQSNSSECSSSSTANRRFPYHLYKTVSMMEDDSANIMISPLAISTSLSMLLIGASGETQRQILRVLSQDDGEAGANKYGGCLPGKYNGREYAGNRRAMGVKKTNLDETRLVKASKLYGERTFHFRKSFLKKTSIYGNRMELVSFRRYTEKARQRMNMWVSKRTNGKLKKFFAKGTIKWYTKLAVISTVYFKGTWLNIFRNYDTDTRKFYLTEEKTVETEFMDNTAFYRTLRMTSPPIDLVELPYKFTQRSEIDASMILLMPQYHMKLNALLPVINENRLGGLNGALTQLMSRKKSYINLLIPKFNVSTNHDIRTALRRMGVKDVFQRGKANFSDMIFGEIGEQPLYVNSIVHKTVLSINEKGTEAIGATGFGMGLMASPPTIKFDRPFIVIILEKMTNSIIFIGRISDPSQ